MSHGDGIMRRDQPTTPFDTEADELTQEFWGASKAWVSGEQPAVRRTATPEHTGSIRVIREGFAALRPRTVTDSGRIERVRRHGDPTGALPRVDPAARRDAAPGASAPRPTTHREATLGELADGRSERGGWVHTGHTTRAEPPAHPASRRREHRFDDEVEVPLTPVQPLVERLGLGAVDPLLVRAGLMVFVLIALVPIVLSLRPDHAGASVGDVVAPVPAAGAVVATPDPAGPTDVTDPTNPSSTDVAVVADPASVSNEDATIAPPSSAPAAPAAVTTTTSPTPPATVAPAEVSAAATVGTGAQRVVPACALSYTAAAGDSWYRIADEAGIGIDVLLAQNGAHLDTVLLPGDDVCLPAGATMPTPPSTTTTTTTTTTSVPTSGNLSREEVQALIRQTWPAEEVDTALAIAERESNFIATADNGWCCVGVFQIYWEVHRGWLDDFGITRRSDLYDARKNIAAAYHLWQSGGWGPWGG
jgi:LysM repeat protein